MHSPQSSLSKHISKWPLLAAALVMIPTMARGDFSGSDSLAADTGNWGGLALAGSGAMVFQNSRLEYLASGSDDQNTFVAQWLPNNGSSRKGWFVEVDVHLQMSNLPDESFANVGLHVESSSPNTGVCYHAMSRMRTSGKDSAGLMLWNEQGLVDSFDSGITDARLRLHYDPVSARLVGSATDGNFWIYSTPISVTNWGMRPSDVFHVFLMARSQGTAFTIGSGAAYFRNFRAGAASPEITVEQPAGRYLKDGKNTMAYRKVRIGKTVNKTILIRNQGTSPLEKLKITLDGLNPKDFRLATHLTSDVLMPGAWVKLKVAFRPKSKGLRKAKLHVLSNDADNASFDVTLSGRGAD